MSALPAGIDRTIIPFAVDGDRNICVIKVDNMENPHVVVTGGSRTGKTSMLRLVAAYAASLGMIVIVFDPKWRWKGVFPHRLPHVLVYDDPEEWCTVVESVKAEMRRRYMTDLASQEAGHGEIIKDRDQFPGLLLIADEFGTLLGETETWWTDTRAKDDPKVSPLHRGWQSLLWRGAEAGIVLLCASHMASADMFPHGTRSRQLHGQRIALGVDVEETAWPMLMGRGRERIVVPDGVRGAGAFLQGTDLRRIQVLWQQPTTMPVIAASGIEILRANNYLDQRGRLVLHREPSVGLPRPRAIVSGQPGGSSMGPLSIVRPATEPRPVQAPGQDTPSSSAGDLDSGVPPQAPSVGDKDADLMLIGNADAAAYIRTHFAREGYTADSFRQDVKRKGVKLPNRGKKGNQTVWSVDDIRTWYRAAFPKDA